jgi:hypothetical protein
LNQKLKKEPMKDEEFMTVVNRVHTRIDQVHKIAIDSDKKIDVLIAKFEATGVPGESAACHVHQKEVERMQAAINTIYRERREHADRTNVRLSRIERDKIRTAGFVSGVVFIGSLAGSLLTLAGTLLYRLIFAK